VDAGAPNRYPDGMHTTLISRRLALVSLAALGACGKAAAPAPPAGSPSDGAAFLAENGKKPGVITTRSGLEYKIIRSGPATGLRPKPADDVKVNYEVKLLGGHEPIDSSYDRGAPAVFTLDRGLVPGWVEVLQLMRPGDEWTVWLPPKLGYGEEGKGPVPPNSVLEFRMELIDVLPAPGSVGRV
jgi:FKBP-type peptidyl-prolyl cis-trans isomerase